jgi:hypothetical protein
VKLIPRAVISIRPFDLARSRHCSEDCEKFRSVESASNNERSGARESEKRFISDNDANAAVRYRRFDSELETRFQRRVEQRARGRFRRPLRAIFVIVALAIDLQRSIESPSLASPSTRQFVNARVMPRDAGSRL